MVETRLKIQYGAGSSSPVVETGGKAKGTRGTSVTSGQQVPEQVVALALDRVATLVDANQTSLRSGDQGGAHVFDASRADNLWSAPETVNQPSRPRTQAAATGGDWLNQVSEPGTVGAQTRTVSRSAEAVVRGALGAYQAGLAVAQALDGMPRSEFEKVRDAALLEPLGNALDRLSANLSLLLSGSPSLLGPSSRPPNAEDARAVDESVAEVQAKLAVLLGSEALALSLVNDLAAGLSPSMVASPPSLGELTEPLGAAAGANHPALRGSTAVQIAAQSLAESRRPAQTQALAGPLRSLPVLEKSWGIPRAAFEQALKSPDPVRRERAEKLVLTLYRNLASLSRLAEVDRSLKSKAALPGGVFVDGVPLPWVESAAGRLSQLARPLLDALDRGDLDQRLSTFEQAVALEVTRAELAWGLEAGRRRSMIASLDQPLRKTATDLSTNVEAARTGLEQKSTLRHDGVSKLLADLWVSLSDVERPAEDSWGLASMALQDVLEKPWSLQGAKAALGEVRRYATPGLAREAQELLKQAESGNLKPRQLRSLLKQGEVEALARLLPQAEAALERLEQRLAQAKVDPLPDFCDALRRGNLDSAVTELELATDQRLSLAKTDPTRLQTEIAESAQATADLLLAVAYLASRFGPGPVRGLEQKLAQADADLDRAGLLVEAGQAQPSSGRAQGEVTARALLVGAGRKLDEGRQKLTEVREQCQSLVAMDEDNHTRSQYLMQRLMQLEAASPPNTIRKLLEGLRPSWPAELAPKAERYLARLAELYGAPGELMGLLMQTRNAPHGENERAFDLDPAAFDRTELPFASPFRQELTDPAATRAVLDRVERRIETLERTEVEAGRALLRALDDV